MLPTVAGKEDRETNEGGTPLAMAEFTLRSPSFVREMDRKAEDCGAERGVGCQVGWEGAEKEGPGRESEKTAQRSRMPSQQQK